MVRINLLPREEKPSRTQIVWKSVFIWTLIMAGIVVLAGVGLHIFRCYEIRSLEGDIAETKAQQEKYREQARLVEELTAKRRQIRDRFEVVEALDKDRFLRVYLLDELARSVPDYVWLERFEENGGQATVRGWAFSNLAISRFMDMLEAKAHIDSVYLKVIRRQELKDTPVLSFEVGYQIAKTEEDTESS